MRTEASKRVASCLISALYFLYAWNLFVKRQSKKTWNCFDSLNSLYYWRVPPSTRPSRIYLYALNFTYNHLWESFFYEIFFYLWNSVLTVRIFFYPWESLLIMRIFLNLFFYENPFESLLIYDHLWESLLFMRISSFYENLSESFSFVKISFLRSSVWIYLFRSLWK